MLTAQQFLQRALVYHQYGDLEMAERCYQDALSVDPTYAETHHLLGVLYHQLGKFAEAQQYAEKALSLSRSMPSYHLTLGNIYQSQENFPLAIATYKQALQLDPTLLDAYCNLGFCYQALRDWEKAKEYLLEGLRLKPDFPEILNNLGNVYENTKALALATSYYEKALLLQPDYVTAMINLANVYYTQERFEEALSWLEKAHAIEPDSVSVETHLGLVYFELNQPELALRYATRATEKEPTWPDTWINLGSCYQRSGQWNDALTCYDKALSLLPEENLLRGAVYCNKGLVCQAKQDLALARFCFDEALKLDPNDAEAHYNLHALAMLEGNLQEAWQSNEWRFKTQLLTERLFREPQWEGQSFNDKTLLVYAEQGYGDTFQFCRFLPQAKALGGTLLFEVQPGLKRLMEHNHLADQVLDRQPDGSVAGVFDYQVPLLTLARLFKVTLDSLKPTLCPYLTAPRPVSSELPLLLKQRASGLKIAFVWSGSITNRASRYRSTRLAFFKPLFELPGTQWFSVQKGPDAEDLALENYGNVISLDPYLTDFADTAFVLSAMDLVISIDTSIAHLAGALGKPTWVLLPFNGDGRWMLNREDSPWYPEMRLFRQTTWGDWSGVFAAISVALLKRLNA